MELTPLPPKFNTTIAPTGNKFSTTEIPKATKPVSTSSNILPILLVLGGGWWLLKK